jgi:hypothetical protein
MIRISKYPLHLILNPPSEPVLLENIPQSVLPLAYQMTQVTILTLLTPLRI